MNVPAIKATTKGLANAMNRFAVKNKDFAEYLVYEHGLKGNVTPKFVTKAIGKAAGGWDKSGKVTQQGISQIKKLLNEWELPSNASWDDIFAVAWRKPIKPKPLVKSLTEEDMKHLGLVKDALVHKNIIA